MKNVPTAAWVCLTVAFLGLLGSLVALSIAGAPADELWLLMNRISNLAGLVLGGGSVVYAGAAARNSQQAAKQTNGALDERIEAGVQRALEAQRAADLEPGGEFNRGR
jgi:hypothetical protein